MTIAAKIAIIAIPVLVVGVVLYDRQPNAVITINPDGSGSASLGNQSGTFTSGLGVAIKIRGWELLASSKDYSLTHFGKVEESAIVTPYTGGSSYVQIINNLPK